MTEYLVISPVHHDNVVYPIGSAIVPGEDAVQRLLDAGAIAATEPVEEPEPAAASAEPNGPKGAPRSRRTRA